MNYIYTLSHINKIYFNKINFNTKIENLNYININIKIKIKIKIKNI